MQEINRQQFLRLIRFFVFSLIYDQFLRRQHFVFSRFQSVLSIDFVSRKTLSTSTLGKEIISFFICQDVRVQLVGLREKLLHLLCSY